MALRELHLEPETKAVCVQAVGKASLLNHSSGPIELPRTKESGFD
jgi:hypothetical protein